jgi:hypothetical protein
MDTCGKDAARAGKDAGAPRESLSNVLFTNESPRSRKVISPVFLSKAEGENVEAAVHQVQRGFPRGCEQDVGCISELSSIGSLRVLVTGFFAPGNHVHLLS